MTQVDITANWTVGRRLAEARKQAGLDQREMANHFAVSRQTISCYENDVTELQLSQLAKWSAVTGIPVEWFFEGFNAKTAPARTGAAMRSSFVMPDAAWCARRDSNPPTFWLGADGC